MGGPGFNINSDTVTAMAVLIGTTNPNGRLYVLGDSSGATTVYIDNPSASMYSGLIFRENGADKAVIRYINSANPVGPSEQNDLEIINGAGDITLSPAGGVGIGTHAPASLLHVAGGRIRLDDTAPELDLFNGAANYGSLAATSSEVQVIPNQSNSGVGLYWRGSGAPNYGITLDGSGRVGIGAPSGGEKLEVVGNIKASGTLNLATGTDLGLVFGATDCGIYAFPDLPPASRMDLKAGTVTIFGNNTGTDGGVDVRITGEGSFKVRDRDTAADRAIVDKNGSLLLTGALAKISGISHVGIASNQPEDIIFNYSGIALWRRGIQGGGDQGGSADGKTLMKLETDGSLWINPDETYGRKAIDSQGRCLYAD